MQIRVWKYLNNGSKQLVDLIDNDNITFMRVIYKELKEMYNYYNYEVEKKGF